MKKLDVHKILNKDLEKDKADLEMRHKDEL